MPDVQKTQAEVRAQKTIAPVSAATKMCSNAYMTLLDLVRDREPAHAVVYTPGGPWIEKQVSVKLSPLTAW